MNVTVWPTVGALAGGALTGAEITVEHYVPGQKVERGDRITGSYVCCGGGTIEGRWIDFTSGAAFPDPYLTTSGTATVNEGAFGGSCPGVTDTEDFSCTTGRQAILADARPKFWQRKRA